MLVAMTALRMLDNTGTSLVKAHLLGMYCNYTNLTELPNANRALHPCCICETVKSLYPSNYTYDENNIRYIDYYDIREMNIKRCDSSNYAFQRWESTCILDPSELTWYKPRFIDCNDSTNGKLWIYVYVTVRHKEFLLFTKRKKATGKKHGLCLFDIK
jgi:hypothetical protein